jgi:3-oxoacyl-[acyl-carrier protein] reductase
MKPFENAVVITGGSKGLGRALALEFGSHGYFVIAIYHADDSAARALEAEFSKSNIEGRLIRHNVAEVGLETKLAAIPEIADAKFVLINNAAAKFEPKPLHLLSWQDFEEQFLVAVKGSVLCAQAVLPRMMKSKYGVIMNILTQALEGITPKGFAHYITAKQGLLGYSQALKAEYGPRGIQVMTYAPGFMDTPLTAAWNERLRTQIRASSGTVEEPETVARKIYEKIVEKISK